MKILLCVNCQDLKKLSLEPTTCQCGQAQARYVDDKNVIANGSALIVGLDTNTLMTALQRKLGNPRGSQRIDAYLLPEPCSTVTRMEMTKHSRRHFQS